MKWFDFHTHQQNKEHSLFNVVFNNNEVPPANQFFSVGLHPWFELNDDLFTKLGEYLKDENCLAVGETGLDRVRNENFDKQKNFLAKHFELALKHQNPIILHCVKAYQDILEMILENKFSLPIIFHDYNGSVQTTERLLKEENIYFSYGDKLFKEDSKGFQSLPIIPFDRILIETDEIQKTIEEVGQHLAQVRGLSNRDVSTHCTKNAQLILNFSYNQQK
jgi:TatD DNase family protein